jgi:hypothetical protein
LNEEATDVTLMKIHKQELRSAGFRPAFDRLICSLIFRLRCCG